MQRIDQAGTFDSDEVLTRTSKVKLSTHLSNRTMTLPGDGNKILAVFEADDFSHSLGQQQTRARARSFFDPRENSNDGALFETEPVPDGGGGLPGIA